MLRGVVLGVVVQLLLLCTTRSAVQALTRCLYVWLLLLLLRQDPDFPALSGARVVRIAVHPELNGTGYGSRCVLPAWQPAQAYRRAARLSHVSALA